MVKSIAHVAIVSLREHVRRKCKISVAIVAIVAMLYWTIYLVSICLGHLRIILLSDEISYPIFSKENNTFNSKNSWIDSLESKTSCIWKIGYISYFGYIGYRLLNRTVECKNAVPYLQLIFTRIFSRSDSTSLPYFKVFWIDIASMWRLSLWARLCCLIEEPSVHLWKWECGSQSVWKKRSRNQNIE